VSVLGEARKAIFGETWLLPVLVAAIVGSGAILREVVPGVWGSVGGLLLLAAAAVAFGPLTRSASAGLRATETAEGNDGRPDR